MVMVFSVISIGSIWYNFHLYFKNLDNSTYKSHVIVYTTVSLLMGLFLARLRSIDYHKRVQSREKQIEKEKKDQKLVNRGLQNEDY